VLLPGGGYFYTNHPVMGTVDALVESYFLIGVLAAVILGLLGDAQALPPAVLFAAILVLEKLITIYHSNSFLAEYIPQDLTVLLTQQNVPTAPPPAPNTPEKKQHLEEVLSVR
jgi:hypothetical protein